MICAHSGPWAPGIQSPVLHPGAPLRAPNAHPEAPHRPPTSGGRLSRRGAASPRRGRARSRLRCRCAPLHVREGFGGNRPRSALRGERTRYECKGNAGIYMERVHASGAVVWGSRGGVRQQTGPCGGRHLGRPHGALGHGRSTPTRAPVGETEDVREYRAGISQLSKSKIQILQVSSRASGTITNRFYVENWVYKGGVKNFHVRCLPPLYIYVRCLPPLYNIGEVNSGHDLFNFNLIHTKFYADFRSGLRFGCYQRTFSMYVIY